MNSQQTSYFQPSRKPMPFLNPFSTIILTKIPFKKTKNSILNSYITKTWDKFKSKLRFCESLFNFLEKTVTFCMVYQLGYTTDDSVPYRSGATTNSLQGSSSYWWAKKKVEFALACLFLKEISWNFQKPVCFSCGQKQCLYYKIMKNRYKNEWIFGNCDLQSVYYHKNVEETHF